MSCSESVRVGWLIIWNKQIYSYMLMKMKLEKYMNNKQLILTDDLNQSYIFRKCTEATFISILNYCAWKRVRGANMINYYI